LDLDFRFFFFFYFSFLGSFFLGGFLLRGFFLGGFLLGSFFLGGFFLLVFGSLSRNLELLNNWESSRAKENSSPDIGKLSLGGNKVKPSQKVRVILSNFGIEAESEGVNKSAANSNISNSNSLSNKEGSSFKVGVKESKRSFAIVNGSFVQVGIESRNSENGEKNLADCRFNFECTEVKPLINLGVFEF